NGLCMISLHVSATNLVNKNRTLECEVFPNRQWLSNESYTLLVTLATHNGKQSKRIYKDWHN
ncbi:hypothetical protein, partial [Psychroserpens sp.]|uniref:hypothetical protein n=1 Tax=Psychroserpens sp. TaxID=2020870 RepID=UPI003C71A33C